MNFFRAWIRKLFSRRDENVTAALAREFQLHTLHVNARLAELQGENLSTAGRLSLARANDTAEKLSSLAARLSELAGTDDSIDVSENELFSFVNEKAAAFRVEAAGRGVELIFESEFDQLEAWFDREAVGRIIEAVLSRALESVPADSALRVRLAHGETNWSLEVRGVCRRGALRGAGGKAVRALARKHGAAVEWRGENGVLCRLSVPIGRSLEMTADGAGGDAARARVMIVEPDEAMRARLERLLGERYDTFCFADGREAFDHVSEVTPDLVVSEVVMDWMRGDELCDAIKSSVETSHIPVILLSALLDSQSIVRALESGADDYIAKPLDDGVLMARAAEILENRARVSVAQVHSGVHSVGESSPTETTAAAMNELDREFLEKSVAIVEQRIADPEFSINRLCVEVGMSRSSFYNKIKFLTDQAPADFIRTIRLTRARELLMDGRHNVTEVADMVGFSDAKHFSTSFKKQFGTSPSKVRQND